MAASALVARIQPDLQGLAAASITICELPADPDDEFRQLASGLLALTPRAANPSGWDHVGYALSLPLPLLLAVSARGEVLAAAAYSRARVQAPEIRMLGATGIAAGAATALLCALASSHPGESISANVAPEAQGYYRRLGWRPQSGKPNFWQWPPAAASQAATAFLAAGLRLRWSELPDVAWQLVPLPSPDL